MDINISDERYKKLVFDSLFLRILREAGVITPALEESVFKKINEIVKQARVNHE